MMILRMSSLKSLRKIIFVIKQKVDDGGNPICVIIIIIILLHSP